LVDLQNPGRRENYICTSFSEFATAEERLDELNAGQVAGHHPSVIHFSRRAAIRADLLNQADGDTIEAREMAPYLFNLSVAQARAQVERTLGHLTEVLPDTPDQDADQFTFELLREALQSSLVRNKQISQPDH
jgi:hypothetical protein